MVADLVTVAGPRRTRTGFLLTRRSRRPYPLNVPRLTERPIGECEVRYCPLVGYEVVIEAMRKAATAAGDAAAAAGKVDLGGAVDDVDTAMPGSTSGPAADALATAWTNQVKTWSSDTADYGKGLSTAAGYYAANEEAAASDFQGLG
jgi:hypothetical protein